MKVLLAPSASAVAMWTLLFVFLLAVEGEETHRGSSGLPLLTVGDLVYEGAFRVPAGSFGVSSANFSEGPIAVDPTSGSMFLVGHGHHQAIAELTVPQLTRSFRMDELDMAQPPIQPFSQILERASPGNPDALDRIGGLLVVETQDSNSLIVNAYEYYDAPADNSHTTLIVRDRGALNSSAVEGTFSFTGGAGHTSGWLSPLPVAWQGVLGGTHLTGQSSGIPIIARASVGPSAFAFTLDAFDGQGSEIAPSPIPTVRLLDYSLDQPLESDLANSALDNDRWTHLSRSVFGMVVPGTATYLTVGHSGGHQSGVCYKCTQNDGNLCGGYCAPDAGDYDLYYWLFSVEDLVAVRNGELASHEVEPYEYGRFPNPFGVRQLGGGSFDEASGLLYLTYQRADLEQGTYANPPVIVAFSFDLGPQTRLFRDGFEFGSAGAWR